MTSISNSINAQASASLLLARNAPATSTDGMVYNDLSALTDLKTQSRADPQAAIKEVSKQFESLFVNMMMKAMRDTLPKDGLFGGSDVQTYQEMFDQQLALDLSSNGSLGLASVIERQLSSVIEAPVMAGDEQAGIALEAAPEAVQLLIKEQGE